MQVTIRLIRQDANQKKEAFVVGDVFTAPDKIDGMTEKEVREALFEMEVAANAKGAPYRFHIS